MTTRAKTKKPKEVAYHRHTWRPEPHRDVSEVRYVRPRGFSLDDAIKQVSGLPHWSRRVTPCFPYARFDLVGPTLDEIRAEIMKDSAQ